MSANQKENKDGNQWTPTQGKRVFELHPPGGRYVQVPEVYKYAPIVISKNGWTYELTLALWLQVSLNHEGLDCFNGRLDISKGKGHSRSLSLKDKPFLSSIIEWVRDHKDGVAKGLWGEKPKPDQVVLINEGLEQIVFQITQRFEARIDDDVSRKMKLWALWEQCPTRWTSVVK